LKLKLKLDSKESKLDAKEVASEQYPPPEKKGANHSTFSFKFFDSIVRYRFKTIKKSDSLFISKYQNKYFRVR
jgi:hypothetical protein